MDRCSQCTYFSVQQELKTGDVTSVFNNFSLDFIVWLDSPTSESSKALRIHHEPLGTQVSEELPTGLSHCEALDVCLKNTPIFGLSSLSASVVQSDPVPSAWPMSISWWLPCLSVEGHQTVNCPRHSNGYFGGWCGMTWHREGSEAGTRGLDIAGADRELRATLRDTKEKDGEAAKGAEAVGYGHRSPLPRVFPPKQVKARSAGSLEPLA